MKSKKNHACTLFFVLIFLSCPTVYSFAETSYTETSAFPQYGGNQTEGNPDIVTQTPSSSQTSGIMCEVREVGGVKCYVPVTSATTQMTNTDTYSSTPDNTTNEGGQCPCDEVEEQMCYTANGTAGATPVGME